MFYWECWKTAQNVLRAISLGLGFEDEEALLKYHSGHGNELSLRHYPPVKESVIGADEMRLLGAHTDFDSITLLFQDNCGGLEVQKSDAPGKFIHAEPIQDTLLMNIGDVLMRWSNGKFIQSPLF
jgi:isopenicillin N synthase-like dioxygenase